MGKGGVTPRHSLLPTAAVTASSLPSQDPDIQPHPIAPEHPPCPTPVPAAARRGPPSRAGPGRARQQRALPSPQARRKIFMTPQESGTHAFPPVLSPPLTGKSSPRKVGAGVGSGRPQSALGPACHGVTGGIWGNLGFRWVDFFFFFFGWQRCSAKPAAPGEMQPGWLSSLAGRLRGTPGWVLARVAAGFPLPKLKGDPGEGRARTRPGSAGRSACGTAGPAGGGRSSDLSPSLRPQPPAPNRWQSCLKRHRSEIKSMPGVSGTSSGGTGRDGLKMGRGNR